MSAKHDLGDIKAVGDFVITNGKRITYRCPRGKGLCGVPFSPEKLPNGHGWVWDGNTTEPTLTPSINCVGGCGWHGFITKGVFTDAG